MSILTDVFQSKNFYLQPQGNNTPQRLPPHCICISRLSKARYPHPAKPWELVTYIALKEKIRAY